MNYSVCECNGESERERDMWTEKRTDRNTDRQRQTEMDRQRYRLTKRRMDRKTDGQFIQSCVWLDNFSIKIIAIKIRDDHGTFPDHRSHFLVTEDIPRHSI